MNLKAVTFLRQMMPYVAGDTASFEAGRADALVLAGVAGYAGPLVVDGTQGDPEPVPQPEAEPQGGADDADASIGDPAGGNAPAPVVTGTDKLKARLAARSA